MSMSIRVPGFMLVLLVIAFLCRSSMAQQNKGDVELLLASGGFSLRSSGGLSPVDFLGSGVLASGSSSQDFFVSGSAGYFITRKNELGGGVGLTVSHFRYCLDSFSNGQIVDKTCSSDTSASFGLSAFYRYNFSREGARGFPFVGASLAVADLVHRDFTGNVRARPNVGYKYFLTRSVALDFSVGYTVDLNRFVNSSFVEERSRSVDGQVGLAFIF
jgi:hypothetical protein